MSYSIPIVVLIAGYAWVAAPRTPRVTAHVVTLAVLVVCAWRAWRTGEWGLSARALAPALCAAALVTVGAVLVILGAGRAFGSWQGRDDPWRDLLFLLPWAAGQQFALQTVLLREAQAVTSRGWGIAVAAVVFGALHLPNPFLSAVTFVGALVWCSVYDRHPNWLPLALSHALATLAILASLDPDLTGRLRIGAAYLALR